ncbi:hypothetical protein WN59_12210 [Salinicoccus sediminis]|uniref:Arylamine N-acetyltransferase n=1 Tax=Salinicoccus sediminis TaxID=1432562 RepID=A0A0M2SIN9_9STAP|nr:arylamine N-acetyltransferase [Salinicoccus sediminis]KKK33501.1 hypothetical protein WN59_12210 [Salinicoccus sediminis]
MNDLNMMFRKRIRLQTNFQIAFENLENVLELTAQALPFENTAVMFNRTNAISRDNLIEKMLIQNEGGLCYELNPLLHLFLSENDFDSAMYYGRVHNGTDFGTKTHVMFLVKHGRRAYLIDTGFGGNLPLRPVPMNGDTVHSRNGSFKVTEVSDGHVLMMNLATSQKGWIPGYKFYLNDPVAGIGELDRVQKIIKESETSPFNKEPLITAFTEAGRHTLTDKNYTIWADGHVKKTEVLPGQFYELAEKYFNLKI